MTTAIMEEEQLTETTEFERLRNATFNMEDVLSGLASNHIEISLLSRAHSDDKINAITSDSDRNTNDIFNPRAIQSYIRECLKHGEISNHIDGRPEIIVVAGVDTLLPGSPDRAKPSRAAFQSPSVVTITCKANIDEFCIAHTDSYIFANGQFDITGAFAGKATQERFEALSRIEQQARQLIRDLDDKTTVRDLNNQVLSVIQESGLESLTQTPVVAPELNGNKFSIATERADILSIFCLDLHVTGPARKAALRTQRVALHNAKQKGA